MRMAHTFSPRRVVAGLVGLAILLAGGPASAAGYLWLSGYDWSGDPTPIYRYEIAGGTVNLVVETGIEDQMVNNLAVGPSTLYLGAGHSMEFWKANPLTGEIYTQGVYTPETPGLLMDGSYRSSNGRLYRADVFSRLYETDEDGLILAVHEVTGAAGMTGLEFVGDQLYCTCDAGFGSLSGEPDWTFTAIPLAGITPGSGCFLGGIAYDQEVDVLYLAVYRNEVAELHSVQLESGTTILVSNLPAEAGYPNGAWPQAMGWVSETITDSARQSWGGLKSLFR